MQRWMRASILSLNSKAPTTILDNTSKAANAILKVHYLFHFILPKSFICISLEVFFLCYAFFLLNMQSMRRIAEESIPRSAENIALAMSALCLVRSFKMVVNVVIYWHAFKFQEPEFRHILLVSSWNI